MSLVSPRVDFAFKKLVGVEENKDIYNRKTFPQILKEVAAIEKAFEKLTILSFDEDEREIYEAQLKWLPDEAGAIQTAEMKGEVKGRAEGKAEGEQQAKYLVAKILLQDGMTIEQVAKYTKLSIAEIEATVQLRAEIKQ